MQSTEDYVLRIVHVTMHVHVQVLIFDWSIRVQK